MRTRYFFFFAFLGMLFIRSTIPPQEANSPTELHDHYLKDDDAAHISGLNFRTLDDIKYSKIGILVEDITFADQFKEAKLFRVDGSVEMVALLKQGLVEAILLDNVEAKYVMAEHSDFAYLKYEVSKDDFIIGFPEDRKYYREEFNIFLRKLRRSGMYDEIYERWINHADVAEMPLIDNPETDGVLRIGTTFESMPFSFIKNGEYAGFDIEIMLRFAAYLKKKPEFIFYNFNGMLAAAISGKVDVIANAIMATDERAEKFDFSNVYITTTSGIVVLKKNLADYHGKENNEMQPLSRMKGSFSKNLIKERRYLLLWNGLKVTFIISMLSALFGTILAIPICFMKLSKRKIVHSIATAYIEIFRGIPDVVLLMIMFYLVFASSTIHGVTVAVITFTLILSASVAEIFRLSILGVSRLQKEAAIVLGFNKVRTFFYITLPQAIQQIIPAYKVEFIALVKMTSIVGYVAVQDLTKASDIIRSRTFDAFFPLITVSVIYFLLTWVLTLLIDMIQVKVKPKRNKKR